MPALDEQELRQADFSHLRLQEMTPGQRAELKRRYDSFVRHFGDAADLPAPTKSRKPRLKRWVPGAKR